MMLIISHWLSLVVIVIIPITILFGRYTGRKYNIINNQLWQITAQNNNFLFDTIQKWREVKVQNLEQHLSDEYNERLQPERKTLLRWILYFALRYFL